MMKIITNIFKKYSADIQTREKNFTDFKAEINRFIKSAKFSDDAICDIHEFREKMNSLTPSEMTHEEFAKEMYHLEAFLKSIFKSNKNYYNFRE